MHPCETPDFWESRYQAKETPWDLGEAAPPFQTWRESESTAYPKGTMAVIGCGKGHDAALFAKAGFEVTGIDYAQGAVKAAKEKYGELIQVIQADMFNLPENSQKKFDWVLEHTFFCAISPLKRPDYVNAVNFLLKPGGYLLGLFWAHSEPGGPPFKTDLEEILLAFSGPFRLISHKIPDNSIESRRGQEILILFQKK